MLENMTDDQKREILQIRATIDQSIIETARTRQMMKWQPWLVLAGYVAALVAALLIGPK